MLKNLVPSMRGSVAPMDVMLGGAAGFVGVNLVDALLSRFMPEGWSKVKGTLGQALPLAIGALAGTAIYTLGSKTKLVSAQRATGFFWGAVAYGVAGTAQNLLRGIAIPGAGGAVFNDVVALPLGGGYGGLLVDNPRPMDGMIVDNPAPQRSNLAALGQLSLGDDEYDGMDALGAMG
jgi:hypothetical protein